MFAKPSVNPLSITQHWMNESNFIDCASVGGVRVRMCVCVCVRPVGYCGVVCVCVWGGGGGGGENREE